MGKAAMYDCIDKYAVYAECVEPLHVGGAAGDKSEVLIHPADQVPFLQASGICGVLRSYCAKIYGQGQANALFGTHEDDRESRIRFSDGKFENDSKLQIELRPRVKIDPVSGTVSSGTLKGTAGLESGHKFDMEYVGAGAKFSFDICLYGGTPEENELVLRCLAALNAGELQFGGQKSNGCGYVTISEVLHRQYQMRNAADRELWRNESGLALIQLPDLRAAEYQNAYEITVHSMTENELLVKGIAVESFDKSAPKAMNIRNAKREYIIPGSSLKGSVRSRMEMIAAYMGLDGEILYDGFGKASDGDQGGMTGNLRFRDVTVNSENGRGNAKTFERTRIRIDKFTGGVINGALFTELNVAGELNFIIQVADKKDPDAVTGLLLLALRDLGCKLYALGGGQNIGKGYVDVKEILIRDLKNQTECRLNSSFAVSGDRSILDRCMEELRNRSVTREAM